MPRRIQWEAVPQGIPTATGAPLSSCHRGGRVRCSDANSKADSGGYDNRPGMIIRASLGSEVGKAFHVRQQAS